MPKKLHYLFLISLLGTACMGGTASHTRATREENPAGSIFLDAYEESAESETDALVAVMTPFWMDITNHPLLWIFASIVGILSSLCTIVLCFLFYVCVWLMLICLCQKEPTFRMAYLLTPFLVLPLLLLIVYAPASLIAAMCTSRWENESDEGIFATLPSFGARFWRFMRFTFLHNILPVFAGFYIFMFTDETKRPIPASGRFPLNTNQKIRIAIHSIPFSLLTCVAGLAYGYFMKSQQQERQGIHGKNGAALRQKR